MGSFNDFLDAEFRPPRNWSLNAPLKFKSETLTNEERELLVECGIQVTKTTKNITVTEVRMSPDLKNAKAYVIPLGGKDTEKTVSILTEFSHLIRKALSKKIDMKFLPKVSFVSDKSFDYAEKIEKLIQENK